MGWKNKLIIVAVAYLVLIIIGCDPNIVEEGGDYEVDRRVEGMPPSDPVELPKPPSGGIPLPIGGESGDAEITNEDPNVPPEPPLIG